MNPRPSISVVIPSYNCGRFVDAAVDSVLAQTIAPEEIIVVDDGSTDDTRARLTLYADRIRYVYQRNGGVSRARNRGIELAGGDLIAFLDADDRWLPEKLAKQLEALQAAPAAGLVHTDLLRWNDATGELTRIAQGRERFSGACYREFFWHGRVLTSSVLARRRCFQTVGMFDEALPRASAEDLDMWLRIARRFPLAFVPEPLVLYRLHTSNATRMSLQMAEGTYYVFAKALQHDPQLPAVLGRAQVREQMHRYAFNAGYALAEVNQSRRARRYFRSAVVRKPTALRAWVLWGATFLPAPVREGLRTLKRRLTHRWRHDESLSVGS